MCVCVCARVCVCVCGVGGGGGGWQSFSESSVICIMEFCSLRLLGNMV